MVNFKLEIAKQIAKSININEEEIQKFIEVPKDIRNGDFAFPCFNLAKTFRKAPPIIANEIKEQLENSLAENSCIEKVEVARWIFKFLYQ